MKNRISTILLVIVIISFNCCNDNGVKKKDSKQPNLTNEEIKRLVLLDQDYVYPLEQAKINVLNLASQLLDSKDGIKRSISKIITVPSLYSINGKTSIKTDFSISKPSTPSLYIANFNGEHGYLIISADKRVTEIIATVGSGTIDSLAHPGLKVFLSNAVMHIDDKVGEMEALRDDDVFKSMVAKLTEAYAKEKQAAQQSAPGGRTDVACQQLRVPGAKTNIVCADCIYASSIIPIQSISTTNYIAQPLLKTLWQQGPPYNNGQPDGLSIFPVAPCLTYGCNGSYNSKYLAGCVAISEGQVCSLF